MRLGINAQTLKIRTGEVTSNAVGDARMRPKLLAQIPPEEAMVSVCADSACSTRDCQSAIALHGAQAMIPPRRNVNLWRRPSPGAKSRNEAVRTCSLLNRRIWKT